MQGASHVSEKRKNSFLQRVSTLLAVLLMLQVLLPILELGASKIQADPSDPAPKYITFLYDDFLQSASRLKFNGSTSVNNGKLRLTPALPDKSGGVFNKERLSLGTNNAFSTYFVFQTSGQGTTNPRAYEAGADGFVFTLQADSNSAGGLGNGIGFGGLDGTVGIKNSLGIEFDMYPNTEASIGDPSNNHIGIHLDGTVSHKNKNGTPKVVKDIDKNKFNFKDPNKQFHVWVDYTGDKIQVFLNDNNSKPSTATVEQAGVNLASIMGSQDVYAGFTSATGGAYQAHDILKWYLTNKYDPIDPTCGCYKEAPSIFTVSSSVYDSVYKPGLPFYYSDVELKNSKGEKGAGIQLNISKESNINFLDESKEFETLAPSPTVTLDASGKTRIYYEAKDRASATKPSFRISTEFGAYQDILLSAVPVTDTGNITTQYSAVGPTVGADVVNELVSTGGATVAEWGIQYRPKLDPSGSWTSVRGEPYTIDSPGSHTVRLSKLEESIFYETRAYARNMNGFGYGGIKEFMVEMPMDREDVKYSSVTPAHLHVEDEQKIRLVGAAFNKLLKKYPVTALSFKLSGNGQTYTIPLADVKLVSETILELKLPKQSDGSILPLGAYDLEITHNYFNSKTFTNAVTITNDAAYRSRNYDEVVVENRSDFKDSNSVEKITLRGPFIERTSKPNVFELTNSEAVVTINDNLYFKGATLTIDKTDPNHEKIKGNGRLYVNGKSAIPVMTAYTIHEGNFEFEAQNFSFKISDLNTPYDYIGMSMPVAIESFTFIKDGIRVKGKMNVEFKAGSAKVKGEAAIDALEFKKNRVDLDADLKLGVDFKTGPVESSEVRVGIDTRVPEYGFGASAQMRNYNLGFEMDLLLKHSKLDTVKFAINRKIKIGSTGAQFTKVGGGVSNMASRDEAPLTFHLLGGLSDYTSPEINGANLLNANDLNVEASINHFGASGKLAIYTINAADLDLFVVANATGYEGFNQPGFRMKGSVDVLNVLVGEALIKYFKGSSPTGYANTRVQIPSNIKLVGGQALTKANIGVDEKHFNAGLSVIGIGFKVDYPFKTKKIDFDVDALQTVKNVANAVVNTGKAIYNVAKKVSSWFFRAEDMPKSKRVMVLSSSDRGGKWPEVIGEKMFEASDRKASGLGVVAPGAITTIQMETNPAVGVNKSGQDTTIQHTFKINEPYKGFIVLNNANKSVRLAQPDSLTYNLQYESAGKNAFYDEASGTVVLEVDFNQPGDWVLTAPDTMRVAVHKALYRNADLGFDAVAEKLRTTANTAFIPAPLQERENYFIEIRGAKADTAIMKPDGRPYVLDTDESHAGWNAYRSADANTLYVMAEAAEVGTWLVDAGADAKVDMYKLQNGVAFSKVKEWRQASEFASMADFNGIAGKQVLLEISVASANTKLYKPDGTLYSLVLDPNNPGWNAKYDESRHVLTALVDVDTAGWWMVKSDAFTLLSILVFDKKATMEELNGDQVQYTYTLDMSETGPTLFDIAGGNESTQIIDADGQAVTIIWDESRADRNAILDKTTNSLKVNVNINKTGFWKVSTVGPVLFDLYKVPPVPTFGAFQASEQSGMNRFELNWKVNNPKADTKVKVMLTENPEEPIGQIVAENLPSSGVTTVTLPDGNLPGQYWLAIVADSESFGPIFKVLDQPISVTSSQTLPSPEGLHVISTGNGEIKIGFTDTHWQDVTSYRILTADEQGKVKYNGVSMDMKPSAQNAQEAIVSGLNPGQKHRLSVMAIRQTDTAGFVSAPSAIVNVDLAIPVPAKLGLQLDTEGKAAVEHLYMPYYVKQEDLQGLNEQQQNELKEKLTVTAANRLTLKVTSDQNSKVELFVNNQSLGIKDATPALSASYVLDPLPERDYTILVEAVNERGDKSDYYQKIVIDRTAPHLSLKSPYNGQVIQGNRAKIVGASETGVRLKINGTVVPVDQAGHFEYFAQIPASGELAVYIVAEDELGNKTEHRLDVAKGSEGTGEARADLAAFATDEGVLTTEFLTGTMSYQTKIDAGLKLLRVWAVPVESDAVVTINGQAVDADHSAWVDISSTKTITAKVRAANNTEKTYTLQLIATSSVASLKQLNLNGNSVEVPAAESQLQLSSQFKSTKLTYDAFVGNQVTQTSVTPTAVVEGSIIRVNGQDTASGQASASIPLNVGDNKIQVQVLSPDDANQPSKDWSKAASYTVTVNREASTNTALQNLTAAGIQLTPGTFDPNVTNYEAAVASNVSGFLLGVQAADSTAVVKVNGAQVDNTGKVQLTLVEGANRFEIVVTAASGAVQTYMLNINRQKAVTTNLNLSKLEVAGKDLNKQFSPLQLNYSLNSAMTNRLATVHAVAAEAGAKVSVNGTAVNNQDVATASLNTGANTLLIRVESPDGMESKTYAIGANFVPLNDQTAAQPSTSFNININGTTNKDVAVAEVKKENDKNVVHVSFKLDQLEKALSSEQQKPVISIVIPGNYDKIISELTGSMIKKMEQKEAIIEIRTDHAIYKLPANAMNIDEIGRRFGNNVHLEDIKVQVQMSDATETESQALEGQAAVLGARILAAPADFRVVYTYQGKELESERFTQYVERGLSLPEDYDPKTSATGVRISSDGSMYHVPTIVKQTDGLYWAHMKSYTNSMYAVISNSQTFADVQGHWAQTAVTDLASRIIVDGKSADRFEPDQSVTRAEFTAMVMRSLGLAPQSRAIPYGDVTASDWFGPIVAEASNYGLISGYEDQTFRPNLPISRAEATAILNKAWTIAGMIAVSQPETEAALAAVKDRSEIPAWAKEAFGSAVKLGLMQGYEDGSVKPSRPITRAETAALLRNLLLKSELIQTP
ncbi:Cadherin-like beta sandwich domain-containing protein [Paenibacillus sp. 1_12]|uniref:cadherin-like beta sandwich domain-containing protein n=1 Tax=Paenibacillus sp. 1_12 TaxID=1566278 RepID=UPI0008E635B1|nr:cadherin-like beta sandwich domain-containing protein [Paenibacillus sp. 1_12]SFL93330.1 Cadherin-like beta sandwich domain-containing protein [Paenibacillus sp. 1_12]